MKKIICCMLIAVLVLAVVGCNGTVTEEAQDDKAMGGVFRYANWGDSAETIAEKESASYHFKDDSCLMYRDVKLMSYNTVALYMFDDQGFSSGMYDIVDMHTDNNDYIDDFRSISKALTEKYGKPADEIEHWKSDKYKDEPGLALSHDDVLYVNIWTTENLSIMHTLREENSKIKHQIAYMNPNAETKIDTSGL